MRYLKNLFAVAAMVAVTVGVRAAVISADSSDYLLKLAQLTPGDILELQPGRYKNGLPVYNLNGTAHAPIVIRGPVRNPRAVFSGSNKFNVVQLRGSSFVVLQNLEIDGMNLGGSGVATDARGAFCSHDITIENFHIHDLLGDQQDVGISSSGCISWNWIVRGNVIERVGTGMYFGNSDGNRQFFNSLIEYNVVIDTIGYNIEVKQQNARPIVSGMPTTDSHTLIRHNVFSKGSRSSTGRASRPNLLVGHMPLSGPGQNDRYEIYGNFFFQNPTEALFQGEGNIYFYDNVMFNSYGAAVNIRAQNARPRDVHLFNNTIVTRNLGLTISGGQSGFVQEAFANLVFAGTPIVAANARDNLTGSMSAAARYLNNTSAMIGQLDLYPNNSGVIGTAIDYSSVINPPGALKSISDFMLDFNGTTQPGTLRGAYAYTGSNKNPGWTLRLLRKSAVDAQSK